MTVEAATLALSEFKRDLEIVGKLLRLLEMFPAFAGSTPSDAAPESDSVQELRKSVMESRTGLPVLSGSLLLYLCGRFEYFVRELIESVVDDLVTQSKAYNDLPESLRKEHRSKVLVINQQPRKYNYPDDDAHRLLEEIVNGRNGGQVRLSATVISMTETNMRADTLGEVLKRIDISNIWNDLGKQNSLKRVLNESDDAQCTRSAKAMLDAIMKKRNEIAHPKKDTTFPSVTTVLENLDFIQVLGQVLEERVQVPR